MGNKFGDAYREEQRRIHREALRPRRPRRERQQRSTWTPAASQPPDTGIVEGTEGGHDNLVSFKTGGPSGAETLITDGDYHEDNDGFRRNHDHHGPTGSTRRGYYTGPGA